MRWDYPSLDINPVFPGLRDIIIIIIIIITIIIIIIIKVALINAIAALIMSVKLATPGLLIVNVFWKKGYNIIISKHDVTRNLSMTSLNSNYIVDMVMRLRFINCSISVRGEAIITSLL